MGQNVIFWAAIGSMFLYKVNIFKNSDIFFTEHTLLARCHSDVLFIMHNLLIGLEGKYTIPILETKERKKIIFPGWTASKKRNESMISKATLSPLCQVDHCKEYPGTSMSVCA